MRENKLARRICTRNNSTSNQEKCKAAMLSLLVVLIAALHVASGEIDVIVPGNPPIDGPSPYKRFADRPFDQTIPYVIGHRGSAGEVLEHSTVSYYNAINHGATFFECDVVLTKDLVPVCRHEPDVSNTTNAREIFPSKLKTYTIDGYESKGVHTVDLTLRELKRLSVRERQYSRAQVYNDLYQVPTLEEYLDIAQKSPYVVGIYPETKHPTWHDTLLKQRGHRTTITEIVLKVLKKHGYDNPINSDKWLARPVFLQSFEVKNLQWAARYYKIPCIQLTNVLEATLQDGVFDSYSELLSPAGLEYVAKYAKGVGPWKSTLYTKDSDGVLKSTGVVEAAHEVGLQVHLYTLRNEPAYHPDFTTIADEFAYFFGTLKVDGGFTDFPGTLAPWIKNETKKGYEWDATYRTAK